MTYNSWKLMNKIDVAVRNTPNPVSFSGYIVEHGDEAALEKAKDWARLKEYDYEKREYTKVYEPNVYTFDNKDFTAKILDSAGGSSQGGRLSFWRCEVEKDGVKFTIGVNDAILADLIKNSDISLGRVAQKVMFARKGGQPGLIHEGMQAYEDAVADMQHKADMKKAKKTSKWEIGGVYRSITQADVCLGEAWDTMEEYEEVVDNDRWYSKRTVTKLRETSKPKKVTVWASYYDDESLTDVLQKQLDRNYIYFSHGKPPARTKTLQLEVKDSDLKLIDELLTRQEEYTNSYDYNPPKIKGRYVRELT